MCNLYSYTKGQRAIRALAGVMNDRTGNMPPLPGIFPDYPAPIVRNQPEGRELAMARWGMPSPVFALKGKIRRHQCPQRRLAPLAAVARCGEPVRGSLHQLRRKRANAGWIAAADLVRAR